MSDSDEDGEYSIRKAQTTSIQHSTEVEVSGPDREEVKKLFDEVWEDE